MQQATMIHNTTVTVKDPSTKTRTRHNKSRTSAILVGLGALIVLLPVILASLSIILFEVNQWNLPGVFIVDQNVSWMDPVETAALVNRIWNLDRSIQLTASDNPNEIYWHSAQNLGYWVDPAATALKAHTFARGSKPFAEIIGAFKGQTQLVMPVLHHDQEAARKTLETLAETLTDPAENAQIIYKDGDWVIIPGKDGRTLDLEATLAHLNQDSFTNIHTQTATLYFKSIPATVQDLTPVLEEIKLVLQKELRLAAYDPITDEHFSWTVPTETKKEWIWVDPQTYQVQYAFDHADLENMVKTWEFDLGTGRSFGSLPDWDSFIYGWEGGQPIHTTVIYEPTTYTVQPGESLWSISLDLGMPMWTIMDANPGLTAESLRTGMTLSIPSKNILLPLPVVENKRILIDISEQKMMVYQNGELLRTHIVSTGISDSPTMAGIFQIQTHEINAYASNWDLYMPHFMGIYEAWPGFMNGIHGLPLLSSGRRLWASSLGSPASYGCIILTLDAAEELYKWADSGVVVEIVN